jgi:hypothetical protein
MKNYKSEIQPGFIRILFSYFKKYGIWIIFLWVVFFLMLRNQNLSNILLILIILPLFIGYGRSYPQNKIIYKVEIDYLNKSIILNSYVLLKHRSIIPFEQLYFECLRKEADEKNEELLIVFGKKPWPVVGKINSSEMSTRWEHEKIKELTLELYNIKKVHPLWSPKTPFSRKTFFTSYVPLMNQENNKINLNSPPRLARICNPCRTKTQIPYICVP